MSAPRHKVRSLYSSPGGKQGDGQLHVFDLLSATLPPGRGSVHPPPARRTTCSHAPPPELPGACRWSVRDAAAWAAAGNDAGTARGARPGGLICRFPWEAPNRPAGRVMRRTVAEAREQPPAVDMAAVALPSRVGLRPVNPRGPPPRLARSDRQTPSSLAAPRSTLAIPSTSIPSKAGERSLAQPGSNLVGLVSLEKSQHQGLRSTDGAANSPAARRVIQSTPPPRLGWREGPCRRSSRHLHRTAHR